MKVFFIGIGLMIASSAFALDAVKFDHIDTVKAASFDNGLKSNDLNPNEKMPIANAAVFMGWQSSVIACNEHAVQVKPIHTTLTRQVLERPVLTRILKPDRVPIT